MVQRYNKINSSSVLRQKKKKKNSVFSFLQIFLRDLAVFPFRSELMVWIKALEIYTVHQTEGKREIPEIWGWYHFHNYILFTLLSCLYICHS